METGVFNGYFVPIKSVNPKQKLDRGTAGSGFRNDNEPSQVDEEKNAQKGKMREKLWKIA